MLQFFFQIYANFAGYITLVMVATFMILGTVFVCIVLWWLERWNRRCYRTSIMNPKRYSLSERYQIQENIKTTRIVNRVAAMVFMLNIFIGSVIFAAFYFETELLRRFAYNFFHIFVTFYGYSVAIGGMWASPLWFHNFTK